MCVKKHTHRRPLTNATCVPTSLISAEQQFVLELDSVKPKAHCLGVNLHLITYSETGILQSREIFGFRKISVESQMVSLLIADCVILSNGLN